VKELLAAADDWEPAVPTTQRVNRSELSGNQKAGRKKLTEASTPLTS
jgi:hypothetical protein